MHFVISWDIKTQGERRSSIESLLFAGLKNFSWVRPLTTFYIVQINTLNDWNNLFNYFISISKYYQNEINFIMTPPMSGGRYNGLLPQNLWKDINNKS